MLALLGALPVIGQIVQGITSAFFNAKVQITAARIGGDVEKARSIVIAAQTEQHEQTARLSVIASNTILTLLVVSFATPFVIYIWKIVVWDIVLQSITHGSTDPIKGQVADWANTIIVAIFGAPTALTIGKMILAKKSDE